jgi:hypothetical protein
MLKVIWKAFSFGHIIPIQYIEASEVAVVIV